MADGQAYQEVAPSPGGMSDPLGLGGMIGSNIAGFRQWAASIPQLFRQNPTEAIRQLGGLALMMAPAAAMVRGRQPTGAPAPTPPEQQRLMTALAQRMRNLYQQAERSPELQEYPHSTPVPPELARLAGPAGPRPHAPGPTYTPSTISETLAEPRPDVLRLFRGELPSGEGPEAALLQMTGGPQGISYAQEMISPLGRTPGKFYTPSYGLARSYAAQVPRGAEPGRVAYLDIPRVEAAKMRLGQEIRDPHGAYEYLVPESYHAQRIPHPDIETAPDVPITPLPWEVSQ